MVNIVFTDAVEISGKPRKTRFGYLVADAAIARSGIYEYSGHEVGKPDMPTVRVYRPDSEVFSTDAMASFTHLPATDNHPSTDVTAENWSANARGYSGDEVRQDGNRVRVPMMLTDAALIRKYEAGKVELSAGYTAKLDWKKGVTDTGEPFDAVMSNIRGNHVAFVDAGRAGATCRFGDSWNTAHTPLATEPTAAHKDATQMMDTVVIVDNVPVTVAPQTAAIIGNLIQQRDAARTALANAQRALVDANTAHTTAISAKDGEIAAMRSNVPTAQLLDGLVAERQTLIAAVAPSMRGYQFVGKDNATIKHDFLAHRCGPQFVAGKDAAFVDAAFATVMQTTPPQGQNQGQGGFGAGGAGAAGYSPNAAAAGYGNPVGMSDHFRANGMAMGGGLQVNPRDAAEAALADKLRFLQSGGAPKPGAS